MGLPIYSKLKQKGFIMLPYGLIRTMPTDKAIVLMELLAELNYARNNALSFGNDFLCDINRLSEVLNIELNYLLEMLEQLEELDLIAVFDSNIEDTKPIGINLNNIINYIETNDRNDFINWNDGLKASLNPINKRLNFNQSTLKIKDYLDSNLQIIDAIPLIYYSYLNSLIEDYETRFGNIFETANIQQWVQLIVEKGDVNNTTQDIEYRKEFIGMIERIYNLTNQENQK